MKQVIIIAALALIIASCSSISPVGNWDYTVTGTPNGDYAGVMTVKKDNAKYSAILVGQGGEVPFTVFGYDPKTKKSTGNFTFQGTPIEFGALVTKTSMEGNMGVEDSKFPFKATRKK